MIFEYAISPGYCSEVNSIKVIRDNFGREKGRIISKSPQQNWKKLVFDIINKSHYGPKTRKQMRHTILRMEKDKAIYERKEKINIDESDWNEFDERLWFDFAKCAHRLRPYKAILTEEPSDPSYCASFYDFDLHENPLWLNPHDISIKRDSLHMVHAIKPLLDCSKEVLLVDRNFKPSEPRFKTFLLEILKTISKRSHAPQIKKITYHTGDIVRKLKNGFEIGTMKDFEKFFKESLSNENLFETEIRFVVWPKDELHARFVLTDMWGVRIDPGLDECLGHNLDRASITRLAQGTCEDLKADGTYKTEWKKFTNWRNLLDSERSFTIP